MFRQDFSIYIYVVVCLLVVNRVHVANQVNNFV